MNQSRHELLHEGIGALRMFCILNKLEIPQVIIVSREDWAFDVCAYYRPTYIKICVERCAEIGRAGMQWSYPGNTVDRTPFGVIAHELGHHADYTKSTVKDRYFGDYSVLTRKASGEEKLTNYCPNDAEWFAEMFRLFVTNPDLLRILRPKTYALLRESFYPITNKDWQTVLRHAPERTMVAAVNKVYQHRKNLK